MNNTPSLDELWDSVQPTERTFHPDDYMQLPEGVRRYLSFSIAPGTSLASAVRLQMRGTIKLKEWVPFTAEQVIVADRGMIWKARTRIKGLPVRGFDRLLGQTAEQRWKILGIIPVVKEAGPDILRSTAGRMAAEYCWLPSALCAEGIDWEQPDTNTIRPAIHISGENSTPAFGLDARGGLRQVQMQRWGNPGGTDFRYDAFGGMMLGDGTFEGYTIPTALRIGWYYGTPAFEEEGEFFRCTVHQAEFR